MGHTTPCHSDSSVVNIMKLLSSIGYFFFFSASSYYSQSFKEHAYIRWLPPQLWWHLPNMNVIPWIYSILNNQNCLWQRGWIITLTHAKWSSNAGFLNCNYNSHARWYRTWFSSKFISIWGSWAICSILLYSLWCAWARASTPDQSSSLWPPGSVAIGFRGKACNNCSQNHGLSLRK